MKLEFTTHIDGKPVYFIDKIWAGLIANGFKPESYQQYAEKYQKTFGQGWDSLPVYKSPKLHTIRRGERWHEGMLIEPVLAYQEDSFFQFAPVFPCLSIQSIEITYNRALSVLPLISIDEDFIGIEELTELSQNDGFDSLENFLSYFNKDFEGQIVHWTPLKY